LTGGQYCPLTDAGILSDIIIGGVREEIARGRLMAEIEEEVRQATVGMTEQQRTLYVWFVL
jgi:hypothetical protein